MDLDAVRVFSSLYVLMLGLTIPACLCYIGVWQYWHGIRVGFDGIFSLREMSRRLIFVAILLLTLPSGALVIPYVSSVEVAALPFIHMFGWGCVCAVVFQLDDWRDARTCMAAERAPSAIANLEDGEPVLIEGTPRVEDPVETPFHGYPTVYTTYEVRAHSDELLLGPRTPTTVQSGDRGTPFTLENDDGHTRIRPSDPAIDGEYENVAVKPGDTQPVAVENYLDSIGVDSTGLPNVTYEYNETMVPLHETELTVLGRVTREEGHSVVEASVIRPEPIDDVVKHFRGERRLFNIGIWVAVMLFGISGVLAIV